MSGCEGFTDDLRRKSSRDVSYDHNVAAQITDIHDSDNNCVTNNLGWHGYEVGSNACSYSGDNWNADSSPSTVDSVYNDCQQSYNYCVSHRMTDTESCANIGVSVAELLF